MRMRRVFAVPTTECFIRENIISENSVVSVTVTNNGAQFDFLLCRDRKARHGHTFPDVVCASFLGIGNTPLS